MERRRKYSAEQIITKLREVEVLFSLHNFNRMDYHNKWHKEWGHVTLIEFKYQVQLLTSHGIPIW